MFKIIKEKNFFITSNVRNAIEQIVIFCSFTVGIIAWYIFYRNGLSIAYNDAMAHMNLARMVVDNMQPGFSQLGGVWLPLNHLLALPLVWNNWAWHSGFAESIISIISYVLSTWLLFKIVYNITDEIIPSILASLTFALNVNMIYLQATPLTESLFIVLFIASAYFFTNWILKNNYSDLTLLSVTGFFLVLSRYDGWFVVCFEFIIIGIYEIFVRKSTSKEIIGKLIIFALPSLYGISLWLFWNLLIFKNPFYFAIGPYSAHAQQNSIATSKGLITKGNLLLSSLDYYYAIIDNVGFLVGILALLGLLTFFFQKSKFSHSKRFVLVAFLFSPILFNILALYLGFSILSVPQFNWNPSGLLSGEWFNVRYGILALPLIAFLVGVLSKGRRILLFIIPIIIVLQSTILITQGVITITDGVSGTSSFQNGDVAAYLKAHVNSQDKVLLSITSFSPVAFQSNMEFRQIIHEGIKTTWDKALSHPEKYVKWIVIANGGSIDPVHKALTSKGNAFLAYFKNVYTGEHAYVYELKNNSEYFVQTNGTKLYEGSNTFTVTGVNSYDLAYKTNSEIKTTIQELNALGVNTIRFWLFGDGTKDGFQPQAGIINEDRFKSADYILSVASQYNMKVIPVLGNNWSDYGGKKQYLSWVGQNGVDDSFFYENSSAMQLYLNYVNKVLSRRNSYKNISYWDDPTILAWDLMNEPRYTGSVYYSKMLTDWAIQVASYTKSSDKNHLVMFGTETLANDQGDSTEILCQIKQVDICSIHLYTQLNDQAIYSSEKDLLNILQVQKNAANAINKPVIIGELGISKVTKPFNLDPLNLLKTITKQSLKDNYNGYLIWNWSTLSDDSFGFSPLGDKSGIYNKKDLLSIIKNN